MDIFWITLFWGRREIVTSYNHYTTAFLKPPDREFLATCTLLPTLKRDLINQQRGHQFLIFLFCKILYNY